MHFFRVLTAFLAARSLSLQRSRTSNVVFVQSPRQTVRAGPRARKPMVVGCGRVPPMDPLAELGRALRAEGYSFVTPTPETHRRVLARRGEGTTLRDVFGWSRKFAAGALEERFVRLLDRCGALERNSDGWRSGVRFSSLFPRARDCWMSVVEVARTQNFCRGACVMWVAT